MFNRLKTPLRFPNDASKITHIVSDIISGSTKDIVSPFFAGGGLETGLLNYAFKIKAYTDFKDLFDFWNCLLKDSEAIFQSAKHLLSIDEDMLYLMQKNLSDNNEPFTKAAMFFAINRSTVTGTVSHGRMQKYHPHFNEYSLQVLRNFNTKNLKVFYEQDYANTISSTDGLLLCCPPPYKPMIGLTHATLTHPENNIIDHSILRELLALKNKWILFLNYHDDLVKMYKQNNIIKIDKFYNKTEQDPAHILITKGV
tara:strand:- start:2617 stop:3381 length:765 start_codon:yes stop_codon:yes gene_type:complete